MKQLLFVLLFLSQGLLAEPSSNSCRLAAHKTLETAVLTAIKSYNSFKSAQLADLSPERLDAFQSLMGVNKVMEEIATNACVLKETTAQFKGPEFQKLCPRSRAKYKLECFQEWLSTQEITNARTIGPYGYLAATLGAIDMRSGLDPRVAAIEIEDSILLIVEKYSTKNNAAFAPVLVTPMMRQMAAQDLKWNEDPQVRIEAQLKKMQVSEKNSYIRAKRIAVDVLDHETLVLRKSLEREPAAAMSPAQKVWIQNGMTSIEQRTARIKNQKI